MKKESKKRENLSFFHNFAAVNVKRKQIRAARVLLAVYLPLLLLTTLHVHRSAEYVDDVCTQCVHHEPHAGHITSETPSLHECVLCQLTTLQYVAPAAVVFSVLLVVNTGNVLWREQRVPVIAIARWSSRAPPFLAV